MKKADILIVGAGAAGLMAAYQLAKTGQKVMVLEGRSIIGGRIHTICTPPFGECAELGAEFIHGQLPITLGLLKEAGIAYRETGGQYWQAKNGILTQEEHFIEHWGTFMEQLNELEEDMSIDDFLVAHFEGPQYAELRASVRQYAEGYDTADTGRASSLSLREEWQDGDNATQYRIDRGYGELINYLAEKIKQENGSIHLDSPVKEIHWLENDVTAVTQGGVRFNAAKIIITAPISILQLAGNEQGAISFFPAIIEHRAAIQKMGMGAVIKVLLQFSEPVWQNKTIRERTGDDMKKVSFIFSQQAVPTWWTQYPVESSLLTGWAGGSVAANMRNKSKEDILAIAIASLSAMLSLKPSFIKEKLRIWHVANWTAEPFIMGSYSYDTIEAKKAKQVLNTPIAHTIYFAGEAIYDGTAMGTVEAALASGKAVAETIVKAQKTI